VNRDQLDYNFVFLRTRESVEVDPVGIRETGMRDTRGLLWIGLGGALDMLVVLSTDEREEDDEERDKDGRGNEEQEEE